MPSYLLLYRFHKIKTNAIHYYSDYFFWNFLILYEMVVMVLEECGIFISSFSTFLVWVDPRLEV